jgi:hypothetical protein
LYRRSGPASIERIPCASSRPQFALNSEQTDQVRVP